MDGLMCNLTEPMQTVPPLHPVLHSVELSGIMLREEWVSVSGCRVSDILFNINFNDHIHLSTFACKIERLFGNNLLNSLSFTSRMHLQGGIIFFYFL